MYDLTRPRLLLELSRRGTMTAAGTALGMTSSAVSQQLAILEREAGLPLLDRVGRRVILTTAGVKLVAHAADIMQIIQTAEQDMEVSKRKSGGTLEIASFPSYAAAHIVPAIVRMRSFHRFELGPS